jgi:hypothetical protein
LVLAPLESKELEFSCKKCLLQSFLEADGRFLRFFQSFQTFSQLSDFNSHNTVTFNQRRYMGTHITSLVSKISIQKSKSSMHKCFNILFLSLSRNIQLGIHHVNLIYTVCWLVPRQNNEHILVPMYNIPNTTEFSQITFFIYNIQSPIFSSSLRFACEKRIKKSTQFAKITQLHNLFTARDT